MKKTNIFIVLGLIIIIGLGIYFFTKTPPSTPVAQTPASTTVTQTTATGTPTTEVKAPVDTTKTVIGTSVGNRDITAYHYGTGSKEVLFVGGIHGGYEWNTSLVAFELMDYLKANPSTIPASVKVTVIPVLNPDGLAKVVGTADRFTAANVPTSNDVVVSGRFNSNGVDLNRNFDCDWKATGVWMNTPVSGGTSAFSEPESLAFKNYVEAHNPAAVVAWFSSAGGVFASNCHNGILPETKALMNTFATASGYKAYDSYDFYALTGDMVNWLAKKNIPGISVLLTNHQDTEWSKNLAGIKAVISSYAK